MATVAAPAARSIHPARQGPRPITAEDLWRIPRVGSPAPAPDGNASVVPVTTWDLDKNQSRTRLWWVPVSGEPRPLTAEDQSSGEPAVSPDGRRVAFTRKKDGGKAQLHVMPLDGGEPQVLTELPLGVFDPQWLPDGSGLVFGAALLKGFLTIEATKAELERREKDPVKAHVTERGSTGTGTTG
jgi:dipeptidyl aminopeptidase/acylaminoacyl peptidase